MRIKKKKDYKAYVLVFFVITSFLLWFYMWVEKTESLFSISYEVQKKDSIISLKVKNRSWYAQKPVYTFLNESSLNEFIKVEGANHHQNLSSEELSNYPSPQQETVSFPEASVVAISYAEKNSYNWHEAQFKTFLKDSLPLQAVSLVGPEAYFFGEKGLYSVQWDFGSVKVVDPSYTLNFELLNKKGEQLISSAVTAHVAGVSTRALPMKSLDLHFLNSPVNSQVIFDHAEPKKIYSLRLRSAGNDFLLAYMRDVVVSELIKKLHQIRLDYRPVVVFINGEYWGIQYLREHISEENILVRYPHLTKDQVVLGELQENRSISSTNGFDYKIERLMDFVETEDLSLPANYDRLTQILNLDNLIDYIIVQSFISNSDWPHNNVKGVFLKDQLHFLLYDTDFAFNYPLEYKRHTDDIFKLPARYYEFDGLNHNFFDSLDHHLPSHVGRIYAVLTQHSFFRERLIDRYHDLLEGSLSQSKIEEVVTDIRAQIKPMMPSHIARWGYPKSMEDWILHTEQIINFCAERRKHVLEQLHQHKQVFAQENQPRGNRREESP